MHRMTVARAMPLRMAVMALTVAFAWLACDGTARAQSLGPLNEFLVIGDDPPWTGTVEGDTYVLANATDGNAVRYFIAGYDRDDDGRRTIAADVELRQAGDGAGAGLIYAYRDEPRFYFAFMLRPGRQVALYRRDESGFNQVMGTGGDLIKEGVNRLAIVEKGQTIELLVNGNQMGQFGNDAVGQGQAGIIAGGSGTFAFKNFEQTVP